MNNLGTDITAEEKQTLPQEGSTQKPWVFKKQENGKFKVYSRENPETLLEGFEEMEWGSPLEGGRFLHKLIKDAEAQAEKAASLTVGADLLKSRPQAEVKRTSLAGVDMNNADAVASAIEKSIADEHEEKRDKVEFDTRVGAQVFYKIRIEKQNNTDNNKPIVVPNAQGGKPFVLLRGNEYTVPAYVYNIIRESIQTQTDIEFEATSKGVETIPHVERIPRISMTLLEEVRL